MQHRKLAESSAIILGAYLPDLWHGTLPSSLDPARAESAADLWAIVRPLISGDEAVKEAVAHATAIPAGHQLMALREALADQLEADSDLRNEIAAILRRGAYGEILGGITGEAPPPDLEVTVAHLQGRDPMALLRVRQPTAGSSTPATPIAPLAPQPVELGHHGRPACQVCGRQDETLRIVVFPYVVSLLFVTFRRAFGGLWCRRHALQWQTIASFITASVGWFGIPFGFFFTPVALLKLAGGATCPTWRIRHCF